MWRRRARRQSTGSYNIDPQSSSSFSVIRSHHNAAWNSSLPRRAQTVTATAQGSDYGINAKLSPTDHGYSSPMQPNRPQELDGHSSQRNLLTNVPVQNAPHITRAATLTTTATTLMDNRARDSLFPTQQEAHRRRRQSLRQDGDFLGVTGVNPYTGKMDIIARGTSSEAAEVTVTAKTIMTAAKAVIPPRPITSHIDESKKNDFKIKRKEIGSGDRSPVTIGAAKPTAVQAGQRQQQWSSITKPNLAPIPKPPKDAIFSRSNEAVTNVTRNSPSSFLGIESAAVGLVMRDQCRSNMIMESKQQEQQTDRNLSSSPSSQPPPPRQEAEPETSLPSKNPNDENLVSVTSSPLRLRRRRPCRLRFPPFIPRRLTSALPKETGVLAPEDSSPLSRSDLDVQEETGQQLSVFLTALSSQVQRQKQEPPGQLACHQGQTITAGTGTLVSNHSNNSRPARLLELENVYPVAEMWAKTLMQDLDGLERSIQASSREMKAWVGSLAKDVRGLGEVVARQPSACTLTTTTTGSCTTPTTATPSTVPHIRKVVPAGHVIFGETNGTSRGSLTMKENATTPINNDARTTATTTNPNSPRFSSAMVSDGSLNLPGSPPHEQPSVWLSSVPTPALQQMMMASRTDMDGGVAAGTDHPANTAEHLRAAREQDSDTTSTHRRERVLTAATNYRNLTRRNVSPAAVSGSQEHHQKIMRKTMRQRREKDEQEREAAGSQRRLRITASLLGPASVARSHPSLPSPTNRYRFGSGAQLRKGAKQQVTALADATRQAMIQGAARVAFIHNNGRNNCKAEGTASEAAAWPGQGQGETQSSRADTKETDTNNIMGSGAVSADRGGNVMRAKDGAMMSPEAAAKTNDVVEEKLGKELAVAATGPDPKGGACDDSGGSNIRLFARYDRGMVGGFVVGYRYQEGLLEQLQHGQHQQQDGGRYWDRLLFLAPLLPPLPEDEGGENAGEEERRLVERWQMGMIMDNPLLRMGAFVSVLVRVGCAYWRLVRPAFDAESPMRMRFSRGRST